MKIATLSGKTIEIETSKGFGTISFLNTEATLKADKGSFIMEVLVNKELQDFFGVKITTRFVGIAISKSTFNAIEKELEAARRLQPKDNGLSRSQVHNLMHGTRKEDFEN